MKKRNLFFIYIFLSRLDIVNETKCLFMWQEVQRQEARKLEDTQRWNFGPRRETQDFFFFKSTPVSPQVK